jgi:hypothetical protein
MVDQSLMAKRADQNLTALVRQRFRGRELIAQALGLSVRKYCLIKELHHARAELAANPFDHRNAQWVADVEDRLLNA